ncbi:MAG: hypothetical protein ACXWUL_07435 [Caldimonas sp.]
MSADLAAIARNIGALPWLYPALEIVHIVGIGLLLGSLVLVELRIWGRAPELPLAPLARFGLRLTLAGFAIAAASGTAMFLTQPGELLGSRPFLVKMALLACAGVNAAAFHRRGGVGRDDAFGRGQTLISIGLWLAIIICGRSIAYY